jgi:hypothetical protein
VLRPAVLRTASCPAKLAGPIAVRSTQFGEGEHGVYAGDIVPQTLELFLQRSTKAISGKDSPSSMPSPLTGEGEGGGERAP